MQRGKIGVAALHQVHQPSGTSDDEMRAGTKGVNLRTFAHAAENRGDAQGQMFSVSFHVLLNLQGEFARGRKNERAGAALASIADDGGELGQHGQCERRRLAGSGLRDADQILTSENGRNGRRLDGRRFRIAGFLHGFQNVGVEAKGAKWHKGKG